MSADQTARTQGLAAAIARVVPALEEHLRFEGPDRAAQRSVWEPLLDRPLPSSGLGADEVLAQLADVVARHGLRLGAPGFCGWVTTQAPVVPTTAQLVGTVAATQRWWVHPGNFLELLALDWLGQLLGLGRRRAGTFTSGGSVANLLGLGAARQHAGRREGVDVSRDGVAALGEARVYASENVHHVVLRALGTLGLGRGALCRIGVDREQRIDLGQLERAMDEDRAAGRTAIAVVASAGDVNTGIVDPIDELRAIAHSRDVWLHVDGAYGGFGVLDPRVAEAFGDLSAVDSLVVDPHKWLAVPIGCGAVFVRDAELLDSAFTLEPAHYVPHIRRADGDPRSAFDRLGDGNPDRGLDHSAPSRGLQVWAALAEIGADGMRARVTRHLDCARRVAERVAAEPDLELISPAVLSICCFRFHPPHIKDTATLERLNAAILPAVRALGRTVPSSTRVNNKLAIRPCFIGPNTTVADADRLVDDVLAAGRQLLAAEGDPG